MILNENDETQRRLDRILDFYLIYTDPLQHGARGALEYDLRDLIANAVVEATLAGLGSALRDKPREEQVNEVRRVVRQRFCLLPECDGELW